MKNKIVRSVTVLLAVCLLVICFPAACISASAVDTYNDVFASLKGEGYSLSQARSSAATSFNKGDFVYVWAWVHDSDNNLYKSYGSGSCDMTLSIYRPDGSCAYSYKYDDSDNNWIGQKLDQTGTWKIQSKITGSIYGTNTRSITVKDTRRSTYNDVFASLKGEGYNLSQARSSAARSFNKGDFVYVWAWVHDADNNLYKSYGSGSCNMTLSIYRPDGSCAYSYKYNDSDNNWIGRKLDQTGTWKIQSKITGSISGTNTQSITVKDHTPRIVEIKGDSFLYKNCAVGDVHYLYAKASPNDTQSFTWSSSDNNVVSISSGGKLTAKSVGTAYITVRTADGRSASQKITVSQANKWKTGRFDNGYTAENYTTVHLNTNVGSGKIRIYTYDMLGYGTDGQVHITLRDWKGNWICEFDAKSGDTLNLGDDYGEYRVYIAKKKYSDTFFGNTDDFDNSGKCCNWGIECISKCYVY